MAFDAVNNSLSNSNRSIHPWQTDQSELLKATDPLSMLFVWQQTKRKAPHKEVFTRGMSVFS